MRVLVFQHLAIEHPGIFRDFFAEDETPWDVVELDEGQSIPALEDYDALMVFGGPQDVWEEAEHAWLRPEKTAIRRWVRELQRPYLGFCLGHQLLGDALGGKVGKMVEPEVGVCDVALTEAGVTDPLFKDLPRRLTTLQWHGAAVLEPPPDAVILAESPHCAVQALRIGSQAYGVQFHMEQGPTTVSEWGSVPAYRCALEAIAGVGAEVELARATAAAMPDFNRWARLLYRNFREIVERDKAERL